MATSRSSDNGSSDDRARLTGELVASLRTEITARTGRQPSGTPAGAAAADGAHKRDTRRFSTPVLHVNIQSQGYDTIDWSLSGLQIGGYVGTLKLHAPIQIVLSEGRQAAAHYRIDCRVTRVGRKQRSLSLQFENAAPSVTAWLASKRPDAPR